MIASAKVTHTTPVELNAYPRRVTSLAKNRTFGITAKVECEERSFAVLLFGLIPLQEL